MNMNAMHEIFFIRSCVIVVTKIALLHVNLLIKLRVVTYKFRCCNRYSFWYVVYFHGSSFFHLSVIWTNDDLFNSFWCRFLQVRKEKRKMINTLWQWCVQISMWVIVAIKFQHNFVRFDKQSTYAEMFVGSIVSVYSAMAFDGFNQKWLNCGHFCVRWKKCSKWVDWHIGNNTLVQKKHMACNRRK